MSKKQFDKYVDDLQKEFLKQELEEYNEYIVNLFHDPKNWGKLPDEETSVTFTYEGPCGDTMAVYLKIEKGKIKRAAYQTTGCDSSNAAGGMVVELVKGMMITEAEKITQKDVLSALGKFPEESSHCALLAANTLKKAIRNSEKSLGE